MQEQSLSAISYVQFLEDAHLTHLFQVLQNNEDVAINDTKLMCQQEQIENQVVNLNPEEIEKGYQSDDGPLKKSKSKRIKKKKPMFIQREEQNKKRRIKLYIESLESRIAELQAENQKLKKINELNIGYIRKLNDSQHIINGFFIDRQKIFNRIEKLLQSDNPDISKIETQCETLKRRQGALGNQRIKAVNYYFKQLLHMIIPNIQKYISEAAYNSTDIFSPTYRNHLIESQIQNQKLQFIKKLSPSDEIIQKLLEKKNDLVNLRVKFNEKVAEMYNNKCDLIMITREMEKICQLYGQRVASFKKAQFLCYAEKNKQEESHYAPNLRTMYEELEKCNRFSYSNQCDLRKNARMGKVQ